MKALTQALDDDIAQQAIQDQCVIDHLVATLGPIASEPPTTAHEPSVEIYHQIRRTWSAQR